jgi:hypothetical protein
MTDDYADYMLYADLSGFGAPKAKPSTSDPGYPPKVETKALPQLSNVLTNTTT